MDHDIEDKESVTIFHIEKIIKINTWDDIVNRPCYVTTITPTKTRNIKIVTIYSFKNSSAPCGVSDCLQAHDQDFLVITSNNKKTSLCEACAQRFFNVSYEEQKKILKKQDHIRKQKIRLNTVLEQSEEIKGRINELKRATHGANWLYRSLSNFRKHYPKDLLTALKELAIDKENNAILNTLADDIDDTSRLDQVKQLQGLGIFATDIQRSAYW